MVSRFLNWLKSTYSPRQGPNRTDLRQTGTHLRQTGRHQAKPSSNPRPVRNISNPQPDVVDIDTELKADMESNGPGKNTLIRNKYIREDTGTHESLKIVDDSLIETKEEAGIDPYNTGRFDRSRNWDSRFRK